LRKQNRYKRLIKKNLYFAGPLSCTELSLLTNKSVPLVAKTIAELVAEGEVLETGLANSTGGRRAQKYSIRKDLMYVIAVAIDQLVTRIALVDMDNRYKGPVKKYELDLKNDPNSLETLASHIEAFREELGVDPCNLAGIGIGMPGFIDVRKGINHTYLPTSETNVIAYLQHVTGLPVLIDNDSSLIALAEYRLGIARNRQNVMVVNIGWGIGLGMILNGSLFRGDNGFAGELSHIPLYTNNKICGCGKTGCLETEASLLVLVQKAVEGLKNGVASSLSNIEYMQPEEAVHEIMQAGLKGDKFAIELISKAGYDIGRGIAILVHLLNPELIVLSGRGSITGKLWITPIQQALNELCIPRIAENLEVKISDLGYDAEIIGAAALIMEHYDELDNMYKTAPGASELSLIR